MNPHLTSQTGLARIDELHREAAKQRLVRRAARTDQRSRLWARRLPRLRFNLRPSERTRWMGPGRADEQRSWPRFRPPRARHMERS